MSGKERRKALLELSRLKGAKRTGSSSSTTDPIAAPPLSVAPAEGPEPGRKRRKMEKAFPSSAAAVAPAPSTEEESSGSPLVHRKRKLPAVGGASSLQPGEVEVVETEEAHSQPGAHRVEREEVDMHLAKQIVLSLEFSTQHRKQLIMEKKIKELEHDKESLQSDFEAAQGSVELMRGMVEKTRGEYLAQVQETIKTEILMGQAINVLDCEVVELRGKVTHLEAETSSLRQLNSQQAGDLESAREAAVTREKKLEKVVSRQRANWKRLLLPLLPLPPRRMLRRPPSKSSKWRMLTDVIPIASYRKVVLSLEFSTQHRKQIALEKRVKELEHDKESLRSDFEAAQGSVELMRGMVEKARREYLAQVQETIKTEILMGQAVSSLDCAVVELRAETSSLRQLNTQLVGELESAKEAAAAGEKRLEELSV
ncbi:uncharacterized protein [Phaseolus vulgaris]|uniref:uncharacterized protein n=1 Tax=Phaseolus vulgaris TaxID=3885 RepID=UPI0035CA319E